jgi:hypothetical protein
MVWGSLWEAFVCLVCCILPGHMRSSWSTLQ